MTWQDDKMTCQLLTNYGPWGDTTVLVLSKDYFVIAGN